MDHCVPAFAERNDYDTVQADQIIQQGVVIVGLVHDEIINQRERDGIRQETMNFQALRRSLSESHEQPQKNIDDIKPDCAHHPDQRGGGCDFCDECGFHKTGYFKKSCKSPEPLFKKRGPLRLPFHEGGWGDLIGKAS